MMDFDSALKRVPTNAIVIEVMRKLFLDDYYLKLACFSNRYLLIALFKTF